MDDQQAKVRAKPLNMHLARLNVMRDTTNPLVPMEPKELAAQPSSRFRIPRATTAEILRHLADLDVIYPSPQMTTPEKSRRFQIFCVELAMYPEPVISAAKQTYIRDRASMFFPAPGQLVALCEANSIIAEHRVEKARPAPTIIEPHKNLGKSDPIVRFACDPADEETRAILAKAKARLV